MGKTLDKLLGRSRKTSKLKTLLHSAAARLELLKNQKQARWSVAHSDIVQLLQLSQQDRAIIRVEQVIKEQNMVDALVMIEGYCVLLSDRIEVVEQQKECPEELKEAISSLIYAASRCGEFPELQRMRYAFALRYGTEFINCAAQLGDNCGVSPKIIKKLSTEQPSLEDRMKALKQVADANGINLKLEKTSLIAAEEKLDTDKNNQLGKSLPAGSGTHSADDLKDMHEQMRTIESLSLSLNRRKVYKDVAEAAQEAFLAAAHAAAAARAAVELSRYSPSSTCGGPPDDRNTSNYDQRKQVLNLVNEGNFKAGADNRAFLCEKEDSSRAAIEQPSSTSSSSSSCNGPPDDQCSVNYDQRKQPLYSNNERNFKAGAENTYIRKIEDSTRASLERSSYNSGGPYDQRTSNYDQEKRVLNSNYEGKFRAGAEDNRIVPWETKDSVLRHDTFYHLENCSLDSDQDDEESFISKKVMDTKKVYSTSNSLGRASRVQKKQEQNPITVENDKGKSEKTKANGNKDKCRERDTRLVYYSHNR